MLEAWLPPRVATSIRAEWSSRHVGDPALNQRESVIVGWGVTKGGFGKADAEVGLDLLLTLDRPAEKRAVAEAVTRLKLLTKWRGLENEELDVQIAIFGEELEAYPEDAVRWACADWAAWNTFFPAWAELRARCEGAVLKRRGLARALLKWLEDNRAEDAAKAAEKPAKAEPYGALWGSKQAELRRLLGNGVFDEWLAEAIPQDPAKDREAGAACLTGRAEEGIYFLALPTAFEAAHVNALLAEPIAEVLGRPVEAVGRFWCQIANIKRAPANPGPLPRAVGPALWRWARASMMAEADCVHFAQQWLRRAWPVETADPGAGVQPLDLVVPDEATAEQLARQWELRRLARLLDRDLRLTVWPDLAGLAIALAEGRLPDGLRPSTRGEEGETPDREKSQPGGSAA